MFFLIVILIFLIIVASTWWFGLWSNLITLINLILSGLIASGFFEDLSERLTEAQPTFIYIWPFVSIWLLFALSFFILRGITDTLSSIRLRFDEVTELAGRSILSIWIAIVFIQFMTFTLHLAPLPPTVLNDPGSSTLGIGPDRMWASFVQSRSRGALSVSKGSETFGTYNFPLHGDDQGLDARVFDSQGLFFHRNFYRRVYLSTQPSLRTDQRFKKSPPKLLNERSKADSSDEVGDVQDAAE